MGCLLMTYFLTCKRWPATFWSNHLSSHKQQQQQQFGTHWVRPGSSKNEDNRNTQCSANNSLHFWMKGYIIPQKNCFSCSCPSRFERAWRWFPYKQCCMHHTQYSHIWKKTWEISRLQQAILQLEIQGFPNVPRELKRYSFSFINPLKNLSESQMFLSSLDCYLHENYNNIECNVQYGWCKVTVYTNTTLCNGGFRV